VTATAARAALSHVEHGKQRGPDLVRPQAEEESCNGARLGRLRPLVGGAVGVKHVPREVVEEEAPVGGFTFVGEVVAVERAAAAQGVQVRGMSHRKLLCCATQPGALPVAPIGKRRAGLESVHILVQ